MLFKATAKNVPKFNREVFNSKGADKQKLGTLEEVMGPFNAYMFSVIPAEGVSGKKLAVGTECFIDEYDF